MHAWASFPRWWASERLKTFSAGQQAGTSTAALRVYLALALVADFDTRTASVSWSVLQDITGLSRPLVKRGIAAARDAGLIMVDDSGYRHAYTLVTQPGDYAFSKFPAVQVKNALPKLPARGFHALDALKIYITLLTVRPRNSYRVRIGHRKLVIWTGVQPRRVRAALDVLINHRLIHIVKAEMGALGQPFNEYLLLGFEGPAAPTHQSAAIGTAFEDASEDMSSEIM